MTFYSCLRIRPNCNNEFKLTFISVSIKNRPEVGQEGVDDKGEEEGEAGNDEEDGEDGEPHLAYIEEG